MRNDSSNQSGYIALITVLVGSAVSVAVALALLLAGTDNQRAALVTQQSAQARGLASACAEEALQQIFNSSSFTGNGNLTLGQGTCTYSVTNTGGSNRTIVATGTVNGIVRKLNVYATIGASSISITSWQEVT